MLQEIRVAVFQEVILSSNEDVEMESITPNNNNDKTCNLPSG